MSDARADFARIINQELNACPTRLRVMSVPSLEYGWFHGISDRPGDLMVSMADDLTWLFVEAFSPQELPLARKMFHAVPEFFANLAKLSEALGQGPTQIDWNLVHYLRRWLLLRMWPTAYQVATGATEGNAGRASAMIKKFTTAEQWREKY